MADSGEMLGFAIFIIGILSLVIEVFTVWFREEEGDTEQGEESRCQEEYRNPNVEAEEIDL